MPHTTALQGERRRPSQRRRRLTLLAAMLLVALVAVGLAVWDHLRRVRVVFANQSDRPVRTVTISHEGRTIRFGPVPPRSTAERRIRSAHAEPIRVAFDVSGKDGQPDEHVEAPGVTASGPGSDVWFQYGR